MACVLDVKDSADADGTEVALEQRLPQSLHTSGNSSYVMKMAGMLGWVYAWV
jgi:hypothetical protein